MRPPTEHHVDLEPASPVLEVLASARVDQAAPELAVMVGRAGLKANLLAHLASDVARLTSDELAERFAHHCPVTGASAEDYKTRSLRLPGFGRALVGIRFRGLDVARPFVTVAASEALPDGQAELGAAVASLAHEYDVFAPTHVRVFLPSSARLGPSRPGQFWEKRLLVGKVGELRTRPQPAGIERLRLTEPTDDGWYARYRDAFERLVERSPEYQEYTRMETREDLRGPTEAGTLWDVVVDGEWAGLVAVALDGVEGVDGYLMVEILLAEHARGRGHGAALYRRLVERLPDTDQLVLGTIDARNLPAIRAARSVGRIDVGGYLWAPCER